MTDTSNILSRIYSGIESSCCYLAYSACSLGGFSEQTDQLKLRAEACRDKALQHWKRDLLVVGGTLLGTFVGFSHYRHLKVEMPFQIWPETKIEKCQKAVQVYQSSVEGAIKGFSEDQLSKWPTVDASLQGFEETANRICNPTLFRKKEENKIAKKEMQEIERAKGILAEHGKRVLQAQFKRGADGCSRFYWQALVPGESSSYSNFPLSSLNEARSISSLKGARDSLSKKIDKFQEKCKETNWKYTDLAVGREEKVKALRAVVNNRAESKCFDLLSLSPIMMLSSDIMCAPFATDQKQVEEEPQQQPKKEITQKEKFQVCEQKAKEYAEKKYHILTWLWGGKSAEQVRREALKACHPDYFGGRLKVKAQKITKKLLKNKDITFGTN